MLNGEGFSVVKWLRNKTTGGLRADLGHGLELRVWHEGVERLSSRAPAYNISVFAQRLETRARDEAEGKRRAVLVARSWIAEARLKL